MIWLPCPRCGDDTTHQAGRFRKPTPCRHCDLYAAVVLEGGQWSVVAAKPGRVRHVRRLPPRNGRHGRVAKRRRGNARRRW